MVTMKKESCRANVSSTRRQLYEPGKEEKNAAAVRQCATKKDYSFLCQFYMEKAGYAKKKEKDEALNMDKSRSKFYSPVLHPLLAKTQLSFFSAKTFPSSSSSSSLSLEPALKVFSSLSSRGQQRLMQPPPPSLSFDVVVGACKVLLILLSLLWLLLLLATLSSLEPTQLYFHLCFSSSTSKLSSLSLQEKCFPSS